MPSVIYQSSYKHWELFNEIGTGEINKFEVVFHHTESYRCNWKFIADFDITNIRTQYETR